MDIVIDLSPILNFFMLPPNEMLLSFLINFGWMPISFVILWGAKESWLLYRGGIWGSKQKFTLLAIEIPKGNEQSLKAVENIFSYLGGAHMPLSLVEKYWEGQFQLSFSFEIISIDGYTQFLVRTPEVYRDLVESAIYSQYPDAEIAEVDDYTEWVPKKYPDNEYDVWGGEFIYVKNHMFPIKTYKEFEHQLGRPETHFKDPMAALMDLYSSMKRGEQFWYQIIVYPTAFDWVEEGEKQISKILKEPAKASNNIIDKLIDSILGIITGFSEGVYSIWGDIETKKEEKQDDSLKMMNLKPKEKKQVEAIHEKISKQGFECKIRVVYIARKELMNKPKAASGFVGYIKQFMDLDLNSFKPDDKTGTSVDYFFQDYRKNERKRKVISAYKSRSGTVGRVRKIFNTEELATLWHFPIEAVVKAPLIQKSPGRKSEPPMSLPIHEETGAEKVFIPYEGGDIFSEIDKEERERINKNIKYKKNNIERENDIGKEDVEENIFEEKKEKEEIKGTPPGNLPFIE